MAEFPRAAAIAAVLAAAGCVPKARPLAGAPAPAAVRLPALALPEARERIVFRWRYEEPGFSARGEGAARVAPPDSARLDFFLDGGFGGGWATLVGGELRTPDDNVARRLVPPAPLLWAALGRLAIPPSADTVLRVTGDTLRADVSVPPAWRVTIVEGVLRGLERLQSGRVTDRLTRDGAAVRYENLSDRRTLTIDLQRREPAAPFAPGIWSR
jgi:hypothetical protein